MWWLLGLSLIYEFKWAIQFDSTTVLSNKKSHPIKNTCIIQTRGFWWIAFFLNRPQAQQRCCSCFPQDVCLVSDVVWPCLHSLTTTPWIRIVNRVFNCGNTDNTLIVLFIDWTVSEIQTYNNPTYYPVANRNTINTKKEGNAEEPNTFNNLKWKGVFHFRFILIAPLNCWFAVYSLLNSALCFQ